MDKYQLLELTTPFGQSHLLNFWDELSDVQRNELSAQIESIDFQLIQNLYSEKRSGESWAELAAMAESPPAITLEQFRNPESYQAAYEVGAQALRDGTVGMILTAGGQGSRLGFEHPKGMYPIGPLSGRTLYQIIFEKVLARSKQFGAAIPMFVMSSPPTHDESNAFLLENNFFSFDKNDIEIFCQGTMPAVDHEGKVLLAKKGMIFVSPDGHGGMLAGFEKFGCLKKVIDRGIKHIFYGQIDNPLIQACDPALIGYHIQSKSEMTTQVVRKNDPLQRVGNVVSIDGRVQIIEYSDLPDEHAKRTRTDGSLEFWAGSIAVHIFETEFLHRSSTQTDALPFHRANKMVPFIDNAGNLVEPERPNAIKFERFIFDLLPWAENSIVCEVDPAEGFCAVKNAPPATSETPEHVKDAIVAKHTRWLDEAGVKVAPGIAVEINPLFAAEPELLKEKIQTDSTIDQPTYFS